MKIEYYSDTDSLYISLKEGKTSIESQEVADGIVFDYDENGKVIGIDIDSLASEKVDLKSFTYNIVEEEKPTSEAGKAA